MAELFNHLKDLTNTSPFLKLLAATSLESLEADKVDGMNCLHQASSLGLIRHVQAIVDRANSKKGFLDLKSAEGKTALIYAITSGPIGHPEVVGILLKAGASPSVSDNDGRTPLHHACASGQDETIELLLAANADPNAQEKSLKKTPLHCAIENGQFNSVQLLCTLSKSPVDLRLWDGDGFTVLHYAAVTQGNAALYIRYFVDKCGLNVFIKSRSGYTAREYAQRVDRFKFHRIVKLLRQLENEATAKRVVSDEPKQAETRALVDNMPLSIAIAAAIGLLLFLLDRLFTRWREPAEL